MQPLAKPLATALLAALTLLSSGAFAAPSSDAAPDALAAAPATQRGLPSGVAVPASHDNALAPDGTTFTVPACSYVAPAGGGARPSLAVGVNNFGTFGDPASASAAGTGFQVPAGAAFESLAAGWWGEGWLVHFAGGSHAYYPSGPVIGAIERVDDHWEDGARFIRYLATVHLQDQETKGRESLLVDFEFVIDKQTCDVVLRTRIENQGASTLGVEYKRVVDWDVWFPTTSIFPNCWSSIPGGVSAMVPSVPGDCRSAPLAECRTTALGTQPYEIDFDQWGWLWGPGSSGVTAPTPPFADWNAGFHYRRTMEPNDVWTTFLRYECSTFPRLVPVPVGDVLRPITG